MASPQMLASRLQPTGDQIRHVVAFARPNYDWSLVDLGRGLSRISMSALEEIDEACLVTTLEVPALHQAKQIIQTLLDSGYGKSRIRLILNRAPRRLDLTPDELEKMLGIPIFCMIPNEYQQLYETYAEGRMLDRGSELGKQMARLAAKLANLQPEQKGKKLFGWFG
jgi:pilus assembly protein CpaE